MFVKIWSKNGNTHLWTYNNFMTEANATLIDYNKDGNIINYIIYEVSQPISEDIFEKYGLNYKILKSYKPSNTYNTNLTNKPIL